VAVAGQEPWARHQVVRQIVADASFLEEPRLHARAETLRDLGPGDNAAEHPVRAIDEDAAYRTFTVTLVAERVVIPAGLGEPRLVVAGPGAARQLTFDPDLRFGVVRQPEQLR
jgi:hypothetical protein